MAVAGVSVEELRSAVAASTSWRGVQRALRLPQNSRQARLLRRRCDEAGIDYSHFGYRRQWTDGDLSAAVAEAESWEDVLTALGYSGDAVRMRATIRNHALRLRLGVDHLEPDRPVPDTCPFAAGPDLSHLRRSGPLLVAASLTLTGLQISWPLEPAAYDLVVHTASRLLRVQVKTTTKKAGDTWLCDISRQSGARRAWYSPEEIDYFGVVDGDLEVYLIPLEAVAGLSVISVRKYGRYRLGRLGDPAFSGDVGVLL